MKKTLIICIIFIVFQLIKININYAENSAQISKGKWICIVESAPVLISPLKINDLKKIKPIFKLKLKETIQVIDIIKAINDKEYDWLKIKKGEKYYYTPYEYSAPYKENIININLPYDYKISRVNNIPFDYKPDDLVKIPEKYISPYQRQFTYYLRKNALDAFISLLDEAKKQNILIYIASAWRSPEVQSPLYLKNIEIAGPKQTGSAKPTHSEHHLGTVCDVTSKSVDYKLTQKFFDTKEYNWLIKNLNKFNMRITYSKENHKKEGYMWEPWHIRFMGKKN